jgi:hypothetical protein
MNTFYKALDLIKSRVESNPLVHTTIFARLDEKDLYKKQIYPIVHIIPVAAPYLNSQVSQFTFDIGAFEQRDISKFPTEDKFTGNDNVIDNLNLTSAILIDLTTYLQTQNNDDNIEVISIGNLTPIQYNDFNILDGWTVQITLQLPNDTSVCSVEQITCADMLNFTGVTFSALTEEFGVMLTFEGGNLIGETIVSIEGSPDVTLPEGTNTYRVGFNLGTYDISWKKSCGSSTTEPKSTTYTVTNEGVTDLKLVTNTNYDFNLTFPVNVAEVTTNVNSNDVIVNSNLTANDMEEFVEIWNILNGEIGTLSDPRLVETPINDYYLFTLTMNNNQHRPTHAWCYLI